MAAIENAFRFRSKFVARCAIHTPFAAPAEQYTVRADYAHAIAGACQRFAGTLLTIEPGVFVYAVTLLTQESPIADSPAEHLFGWTTLQHTLLRGALAHHTLFHRYFGNPVCANATPHVDCPRAVIEDRTFSSLIRWATEHARAFDGRHVWPAAVRAARLLQKSPQHAWYVDDLARAVNVTSATLERGFRRIYGISAQRYQCLVRLRAIAHALRADASAIEGVILDVGYRSVKDVYVPFRRITEMTPAMVRHLTESQFASLVDGRLALPTPGCRRQLLAAPA
jgi:AraC-like DNA-binding protein